MPSVRCLLASVLVIVVGGSISPATAIAERQRVSWVGRYDDGEGQFARFVFLSPDEQTVFVAGTSSGDFLTIAYDATSGDQRWINRADDPHEGYDEVAGAVLSPDGGRLYLTGQGRSQYFTQAIDTATGETAWTKENEGGFAWAIGVSPDGALVFVTGSAGVDTAHTIAYDAATGDRIWRTSSAALQGHAVTVSPDGSTVYAAGAIQGSNGLLDIAVLALDAAHGSVRWRVDYDGPGHDNDEATNVLIGPDGRTLFVSGWSYGAGTGRDYLTMGIGITAGHVLWTQRYDGPAHGSDVPMGLALAPDGHRVFVTGTDTTGGVDTDLATVAYAARTGGLQWVARYDGPAEGEQAKGIRYDAARQLLDVFGASGADTGPLIGPNDAVVVSYDPSTGSQLGVLRFDGPTHGDEYGMALAASSDGRRGFLAGSIRNDGTTNDDVLVVAFRPIG